MYRLFGWASVLLFFIFMIQNAKDYFLAPVYPLLFAAGTAGVDQSILGGRLSWIHSRAYAACLVILGLIIAPLTIPMLPVATEVAYLQALGGPGANSEKFATGVLPQYFPARFGWQEMAPAFA